MNEIADLSTGPVPFEPVEDGQGSLWAIVLAGGEGVRLRPLVDRLYGEHRPKQFAALTGPRSLLRQTLARTALLVPPERTVVVTLASHARYVAAELGGVREPRVLVQPQDRGTAAAILFPAHWIQARDPRARVAIFPSDHFILEEAAFMGHVEEVAAFVARHPAWMVLLGAQPTEPETDYGWIEPGERVAWTARGPLYRVYRFREKPSEETARSLFATGCLWNTLVLISTAATLVAAGEECVPTLHARLARLRTFAGTPHETWAVRQAYSLAPAANFSHTILELCPVALAVSKLPAITWCDLGTPARVVKTLRRAGISTPWLETLEAHA